MLIYEAQRENIEIIRNNLRMNKVNGQVYNLAVAENNGEIELSYEKLGGPAVGLRGNNRYKARSISLEKVLSSHNIDIAKFDCEGCEYVLLKVPCEIIRNVPKYVIEYHRGYEKLKEKFEICGYRVKELWKIDDKVGGFKAEFCGNYTGRK